MGIPGFPITGVTLKNLRMTAHGGGKSEWAVRPVPERESEYPDAGRFGDLPAYGLYCRHVDGLVLDGINLAFGDPDARPALVLDDVKNADVRMLLAKPPEGDQPAVRFHNVRDSFVQGCRALPGTKTWAALSGAQTAHLHETGNDFAQAATALHRGDDVPSAALSSPATR
jgi:hypothetical protein